MYSITDFIKNADFLLPSDHEVLASDPLTDAAIVQLDRDKRRTYVVLVEGQSYGLSSYDLEQQERFLDENRKTSMYSAISRALCKVMATITDSKKRIAVLQGINALTTKIQQLEGFHCPRLEAAQKDAKGDEAMALFEGNTVFATAEACYLTYPTFNYTPISDTVDGIKVENVVQWGRANLKFVMSHEEENQDGLGQKIQRWFTARLDADWEAHVNAELRKFHAVVALLKEDTPAQKQSKAPVVGWTCSGCNRNHVATVPRTHRYTSQTMNIACPACGKINEVDYKP
ncbi:hypothetical protein A4K93_00245 [Salmonella enterica subsp. enterica serovar Schwarzengrund]|uniref:Uncharacterized protein n=1 Tax=Salmonella enterica subsp. enterica serovar Schwarzengrund TaxID=340190 RepID=A0A5W3ERK3_SALET|nr:hypothetical protein [Salmonella enterica subsp. enterica serovar Schwarzengrund]